METLQNLLTIAIEVVAIAGFGGIVLHALYTSHCEWMKTYCPVIQPVAPVVEPTPEKSTVEEPTYAELFEQAEEIISKPIYQEETAAKELTVKEPTPALSQYEVMSVKQLRQECQIHCIDWRRGGDYGKAMRKNQMIRALTA
jgi:hypothetical protein